MRWSPAKMTDELNVVASAVLVMIGCMPINDSTLMTKAINGNKMSTCVIPVDCKKKITKSLAPA